MEFINDNPEALFNENSLFDAYVLDMDNLTSDELLFLNANGGEGNTTTTTTTDDGNTLIIHQDEEQPFAIANHHLQHHQAPTAVTTKYQPTNMMMNFGSGDSNGLDMNIPLFMMAPNAPSSNNNHVANIHANATHDNATRKPMMNLSIAHSLASTPIHSMPSSPKMNMSTVLPRLSNGSSNQSSSSVSASSSVYGGSPSSRQLQSMVSSLTGTPIQSNLQHHGGSGSVGSGAGPMGGFSLNQNGVPGYPQFMNQMFHDPMAKLLALQSMQMSAAAAAAAAGQNMRKPLNLQELQSIFQAADNHPNQTRCKRDIAILALLFDLHVSSGSMIRLSFQHVPTIIESIRRGDDPTDMAIYDNHMVHVVNVTNSEITPTRCGPFTAWALRHWILELVESFQWNLNDVANPLFVNSQPIYDPDTGVKLLKPKPLKRDAISKVFQATKTRCGLNVHKNTVAISNLEPIQFVYKEWIKKFSTSHV